MTPAARLQAAIEILDAIDGGRTAEKVLAGYFRRRRYAGGGDRAAVSALVYQVLRRRSGLDWRCRMAAAAGGELGNRARAMAALLRLEGEEAGQVAGLFAGERYGPAPLAPDEARLLDGLAGLEREPAEEPDWARYGLPEWLAPAFRERFGGELGAAMAALNRRAPVDLRVNALKTTREAALTRLTEAGFEAAPCLYSPLGIRLGGRARVVSHALYRSGAVELQDEGSQLVALMCGAAAGMQVVDLCAGAGGKTLALAAAMANTGQIYACDVDRRRLARLAPRLARAGARNVQSRAVSGPADPWLAPFQDKMDRVLVDAPCSGSGAWRRHPDDRWRLDPAALARHQESQDLLLSGAAPLVRPGGRLVYATCSLLVAENETPVERFLAGHAEFRPIPAAQAWAEAIGGGCPSPGPWLILTPHQHGTDGFFVAVLERAAT